MFAAQLSFPRANHICLFRKTLYDTSTQTKKKFLFSASSLLEKLFFFFSTSKAVFQGRLDELDLPHHMVFGGLNHSQPRSCSPHVLLAPAAAAHLCSHLHLGTTKPLSPCSPSCCPWHSRTSLYSPAKVTLADAFQAMMRPLLATKPVKFDFAAGKF